MSPDPTHRCIRAQMDRRPRLHASGTALLLLTCWLAGGCRESVSMKIVFQSARDGNFEIYTMNPDGSDQRRLTNNPANDVNPSWSPDGSRIAFASDRDGNWEIYSMLGDGSDQKRLTRNHGTCTSPSWAMHGSKILFVSTFDAPNGNLYLMNTDGSGVAPLTADSLVKDTPVLSPDGHSVIMTVNQKGRYRIASYTIATRGWHFLTPDECNSLHPSLSPDGTQILFASDRAGNYDIYSMDNLGVGFRRITTDPAGDLYPAWAALPGEILLARGGSIYRLRLSDGKEFLLSFKGDSAPNSVLP